MKDTRKIKKSGRNAYRLAAFCFKASDACSHQPLIASSKNKAVAPEGHFFAKFGSFIKIYLFKVRA